VALLLPIEQVQENTVMNEEIVFDSFEEMT